MKKVIYLRDSYEQTNLSNILPEYTHIIENIADYRSLEDYIDELVDFAAEVHKAEPTWR